MLGATPAWLGGLLSLLLIHPGSSEPSARYLYSEVIVPILLESPARPGKTVIEYMIEVEKDYKVLHLEQISFIIANLPIYTYNMKGDMIADYPYIQDDCYYSGYVEGVTDSQVVLSTCAGLWGHVQIGTLRYEIEPIENSPKFQHLIYRKTPELREPCRGVLKEEANLTSEDEELQMVDHDVPMLPSVEEDDLEHNKVTSYLEYYAVIDKGTFVAQKHNETLLVLVILLMMSNVHAMYLPLDLHVYLVGLELWTERDHITISVKNLGITLQAFYKYVHDDLWHRTHFDHAGIITTEGNPAGLTWGDHFCHYTHVSVSAVRTSLNPRSDAELVVHELGHSFGFPHDDAPGSLAKGCDCNCIRRGHCLMVATGPAECGRLSNCSRKVYYDLMRKLGKECLLDVPAKILKSKVCGNRIVEDDEECDCGQDEDREGEGILNLFLRSDTQHSTTGEQFEEQGKYEFSRPLTFDEFKGPRECQRHGCCQENCKVKPDIDCLYGACCEKCKFLKKGTVCRPESSTECDLPEYCNGTSAACPDDLHKQDGTLCGNGNSCFLGNCLGLRTHCISLFGQGAQAAPLSCFKELNMRGDQFGNCGKDGLKYRRCEEQDVLCGRLQCTHIKTIPKIPRGQEILQTPLGDMLCWGTKFYPGEDAHDSGAVKDGTACGTDKLCINRSCVDRSVLNDECNVSRCNNRGVCNSRGNCHCSYGWGPPFCTSRGFGGSIDSGPPAPARMTAGHIVGFVALAGLVLSALGLMALLKRQPPGTWYPNLTFEKSTSESEESTGSSPRESIEVKSQDGKLDLTEPM